MQHDEVTQAALEDQLNLFLTHSGDTASPENLSDYSEGLCNAFAFLNFRAELINQQDKNLDRIENLMSMMDSEIVEMATLYAGYTQSRRNMIEMQGGGNQLSEFNAKIRALHQHLTDLRQERQEQFNPDVDMEQIAAWKKNIELPVEEQIRQLRNTRDKYIDEAMADLYNENELYDIEQARDLYLYIHNLVGAFSPGSVNFTIQGKIVNQYDYAEILQLLPPDTLQISADPELAGDQVKAIVENVFSLGLVLDKNELTQLLGNKDILREGDLISITTNDHAVFLTYNDGELILYDPVPVAIEPNNFARLVDIMAERFFPNKDLETGFMPIGINVYQRNNVSKEISPRLNPAEVTKSILNNRSASDTKLGRDNTTSAWMATLFGNNDVIQVLANAGENLSTPGTRGESPASLAIQLRHNATLSLLAGLGADISKPDMYGDTPVLWAAKTGNEEALQILKTYGVNLSEPNDYGVTPALEATENCHPGVLKFLQESGVDLTTTNEVGQTLACIAAERGHVNVIKMLDELGIDLNAANREGETPAFIAARLGRAKIIEALHEAGIDLTAPNAAGKTLALIAAENGHSNVLVTLHELGVDLNASNDKGNTPALAAAESGQAVVIKYLFTARVDLTASDDEGMTPALVAARDGHSNVIEMLDSLHIDLNAATNDGWTPALVAASSDQPEVIRTLHGLRMVNLSVPDAVGRTPALLAAQEGNISVIEMLDQLGIDLNAANEDGDTPETIAKQAGHTHVVERIKQLQENRQRANHQPITQGEHANVIEQNSAPVKNQVSTSAYMHSVLQANNGKMDKPDQVKEEQHSSIHLDKAQTKEMEKQTASTQFFKAAKKDDVVASNELQEEKTPPRFKK